ncbi:riboflavin biosynthesis protein PYRD, chloroplastic isoform X2 [Prosopis cineraria]|nr:riboflavin biosynthesis protein PYRD, chloroplastic isoform X2 [Prosopis cineraria]
MRRGLTPRFYESLLWVNRKPVWSSSFHSIRVQCNHNGQYDDGFYMRRSVELARKAIGLTSPNPMVGCVIVKDGEVVGEGFHPKAGQPHAEVFALRDAGDLAENATAYVSLEPCNHVGRTPPCTEALIKAKVKKVVVGMVDPNPIVASKGVHRLRDAGIEVVVGVEEELCKGLLETYTHRMLTGKPFVALRYSLSLNGNFLDVLGGTAAGCGGYYSRLLQEYDAVVLSSSLFSENLPLPSSQEPGANQPMRIILRRNSSSSNQASFVIKEVTGKDIIFTDNNTTETTEMAQQGIETVAVDEVNLDLILDYCYCQGLCSVLLDLRGSFSEFEELVKEGVEKKYFNKFVTEILPVWNGSVEMDPPKPLKSLKQGVKVINLQSKALDQSVVIEGYCRFD